MASEHLAEMLLHLPMRLRIEQAILDTQPCSSDSHVIRSVIACKILRQGKKEKWKYLGTMSTCAIIGKQPALEFQHILCIVALTISKSLN